MAFRRLKCLVGRGQYTCTSKCTDPIQAAPHHSCMLLNESSGMLASLWARGCAENRGEVECWISKELRYSIAILSCWVQCLFCSSALGIYYGTMLPEQRRICQDPLSFYTVFYVRANVDASLCMPMRTHWLPKRIKIEVLS